ncbi:MAG: hypothetical protein WB992_15315 [Bryobacteraceae bacterium]
MRRHVFTECELDLLLDLETCRVRKSARAQLLRRYLKAVHQSFTQGALKPLRLSLFVELETRQRPSSNALRQAARATAAR